MISPIIKGKSAGLRSVQRSLYYSAIKSWGISLTYTDNKFAKSQQRGAIKHHQQNPNRAFCNNYCARISPSFNNKLRQSFSLFLTGWLIVLATLLQRLQTRGSSRLINHTYIAANWAAITLAEKVFIFINSNTCSQSVRLCAWERLLFYCACPAD